MAIKGWSPTNQHYQSLLVSLPLLLTIPSICGWGRHRGHWKLFPRALGGKPWHYFIFLVVSRFSALSNRFAKIVVFTEGTVPARKCMTDKLSAIRASITPAIKTKILPLSNGEHTYSISIETPFPWLYNNVTDQTQQVDTNPSSQSALQTTY
jgi:hypothetical protein